MVTERHDYKKQLSTTTDTGEPCVIPSESWERELMTPNLETVMGPLKTPVWRYMKFEHLAKCLQTQKLFYPRVDTLGDPLEGSFSQDTVGQLPLRFPEEVNDAVISSMHRLNRQTMQRLFYVSCWHINKFESDMHWSKYGSHTEAVAVRSTIGRLCTLTPKKLGCAGVNFIPRIFAGEVSYIDHDDPNSVPPGDLSLLYKSGAYSNDVEFRSIIQLWNIGWSQHDNEELPIGVEVDIAPAAFFDQIVVAAKTDKLTDKVNQLLLETGFEIEVKESILDRKPKW